MVGDDQGREVQPYLGTVDRLDEERDLTTIVGRYFVTLEDIPERVETGVRNGEQERYKARRAVSAGTTLLVSRMRFLDDVLHSVEMLAHPADPDRSPLPFMTDEFFTYFAPAEEGVRARERAAILAEMDAASARIMQTQRRIAIAAPTQQSPADKSLVAVKSKSETLAERMRAMVAAAEEQKSVVEREGANIRRLEAVFQRFTSEMSTSALGMISDQIEFATSVSVGLKTLSFFTGEGVEVTTLRQGESAPADEPLTLYQNLLYLDEELAVDLLAQGFDYRQMDELPDILADRSLVDRMIPAARGAVLVRVRHESAVYVPETTLGAMMVNAALNMENRISYLLVKDGENLHLVHSEVTSDETRHLFPARKEIDDIFRMSGREVRPEHLEYSAAKDKFEKRTVFYRRLMLMMWGLDERLHLFGDFHEEGRYDGWFDDRFHMERMVYVHDGEDVLEHSRPSFSQWADEKNTYVQSGSRIAVTWGAFINDESLPEAFEYTRSGHVRQVLFPVDSHSVAKVEKRDDSLVVKTRVKELYGNRKKPKVVYVSVAEGLYSNSGLCLDMVERSEMWHYLNSRRERRSYSHFLANFRMVDDLLERENDLQATTVNKLKNMMGFSGLHERTAQAALQQAVVLWRAQHDGALLGGRWWKRQMETTLLDMAYAIAGKRADLLEKAAWDIPGIRPLELRINGLGDLVLYRELKPGEGFPGIGLFDGKWVGRTCLSIDQDGHVSEAAPVEVAYLQNPDFERRIFRRNSRVFRRFDRELVLATNHDSFSGWLDNEPDWLMPDEAKALAEAVSYDGEEALSELTPSQVRGHLYRIFQRSYKQDRTKKVDVGRVTMPLAIVRTDDRYGLLQMSCIGTDFYPCFGPEMAEEALRIVDSRFAYPENKVKRIAHVSKHFSRDRLPFELQLVWSKFDRVAPGLSFCSEENAVGDSVRVFHHARYVDGVTTVPGDPLGSLTEAIKEHARNAIRNVDVQIDIRFANEANRRLAERYFKIMTNTDEAG